MSLTRHWSQADCLSQIVLTHALRQATVWLSFDVRQKKTMPMNIYRLDEKRTRIAYLCRDVWRLPEQVVALEKWVIRKEKLGPGECVADIGFSWRRDARGGGSSLSPAFLKSMVKMGITLHLSEYPGYAEPKKTKKRK